MFLPIAEPPSPAHDQQLLTPGDLLWAAGRMIKALDHEFPHGWMKRIHADDAKQSTQIDFHAVIG